MRKLEDTWQELLNKIKSAGVKEAISGAVANEIADIASRSRASFADVAAIMRG